jgi:predicted solute-binding protein
MTDSNNVSANAIPVVTADGTANVQPELLREYLKEAFSHLDAMNTAKLKLKEVIEAAADGTGLSKKLVGKYFKARYSAKVKETTELGALFERLDEVVEA